MSRATIDASFDSVRLMRELRARISRDVREMTEDQRGEYIRVHAERFWNRSAVPQRDTRPELGR